MSNREITDIYGNTSTIDCIACAIESGQVSNPGFVAKTIHFSASQDFEIPIPGFVILASKRHMQSVDEFSDEEQQEFIRFLCTLRGAMREALKIDTVYLIQEEDTSSHFHVWLFPRHEWMGEQFGRKIKSVRPIMEYARENMKNNENMKEVEKAVQILKSAIQS